jgi:PAS domain S-box-containing protein
MFSLDQKYIQRLIESSPDMIVAVDSDGTIVYYNDGARKSLHYTGQEMIGGQVSAIYPSIDEARRVMKAMRDSGDGGRISNFETNFRDKDGSLIPVMISGSIIYDDEHKEIGSIGFARDIRRMRARQQLATVGEIAVSLAHEINNPLESITNNLELLARAIDGHMKDAELATENEHLDAIRAGIGRVNAIVRRLDEMSRKGIYETRDYLNGKRMADLAPREAVALPKHITEHAQAPTSSEQGWPLAGMAVLVLDDDGEVVTSLADVLRAERCIVHTAMRPSAALGILRNMKIDAVISDVVMPEMDGYEFYVHVKQEMPQIPVVLMTAYYYDKDHIIKRSKLKGLEGAIFKKPVNPGKLRQMLIAMRQKNAAPPKPPMPPASTETPPTQPGATR